MCEQNYNSDYTGIAGHVCRECGGWIPNGVYHFCYRNPYTYFSSQCSQCPWAMSCKKANAKPSCYEEK